MKLRFRVLLPLLVCLALGAFAPAALADPTFHPRIGNALGLIPPVNNHGDFNTAAEPNQAGLLTPVVYHGGPTMSNPAGVTVHAIFWTPDGTSFPTGPTIGNQALITRFYSDVSAESNVASPCDSATDQCNVFSVENQYGSGTTPANLVAGNYKVNFNSTSQAYDGSQNTLSATDDVITDTDAPPALPSGVTACSSPLAAKYCILDSQVQDEVSKIVTASGGSSEAGTTNLWYVFLPPDLDECISYDVCGTNAFGGYHSLSDVGSNGVTIYAVTIDPTIEAGQIDPGADPNGNPDAEVVVDIAAHETNEAMSDPEGTGYMNPNGWEVADMCEFGPQRGTPLGFAANGSPYNQVIGSDKYLVQEMWSNAGGDDPNDPSPSCVRGTENSQSPLPLPQVNLMQFSSTVTGNTENNTGNGMGIVTVTLYRSVDPTTGSPVALKQATGLIGTDGTWSVSLAPYGVGDDRDELAVHYSGSGAPSTTNDAGADDAVILTGNGGNPFTESGWTGWTALDNGTFLTTDDTNPWATALTQGGPSLTMGPCFQTGVLSYTIDNTPGSESPTDFCSTALDVADTPLADQVGPSDVVTDASLDNRSFQPQDTTDPNLIGSLVNLSVPVGEPDSVSAFPAAQFPSTGFPTCTADLAAQTVTCTGLVPDETYTVTDGGQSANPTADDTGTVVASLSIHRNDAIALSNGSQTLTTLHVANLQVALNDANPGVVTSGICSAGLYWGGPPSSEPTNDSAGDAGVALTGTVCPSGSNNAANMSTPVAQTDDLSGGSTVVNLPDVADTSPIQGETEYGTFTALSESTSEALPISVSITPASGGAPVFQSANTDTDNGVAVPALTPGTYNATWTVTDPNGDTRILTTRFIEQSALQGPQGPQGAQGPQGPQGPQGKQGPPGPKPTVKCTLERHGKIKCTVTFPKSKKKKGTLRVSVSRGGRLVALGNAKVVHGRATLTMRELRTRTHGAWAITVVFSKTVQTVASTQTLPVRVR